jgi:hypothetical protein
MADTDTLAQLATEVGTALSPLDAALESPESFQAFAAQLGWDLSVIPAPIAAIGGAVTSLIQILEAGEIDSSSVQAAVTAIRSVISGIQAIESQPASAFPPSVDPVAFAAEFAEQLIDFLVVDYLLTVRPPWGNILRTLGVIRLEPVAATANRPSYVKRSIAWSDLGRVLSDPTAVFRDAWQWGTATFAQQDFFNAVLDLADGLGLTVRPELLDPAVRDALSGGAPGPDEIHDWVLRMPIVGDPRDEIAVELGLGLFMLPPTGPALPGFALLPYAIGTSAIAIDLTDTLQFTVDAAFDLEGGAGLVVKPGAGPELIFDLIASAGANTSAPSSTHLAIGLTSTASTPTMLLGSSDASHLQIGGASLTLGARLTSANKVDIYGELAVQDGQLIIKPADGDSDSFIATILPEGGIAAGFNFGVGVSSSQGIYFAGSSGLEIQLPIHVTLGPIDVTSATLTIGIDAGSIPIGLGVTFDGSLGPISASVENIGLVATLTFPPTGGNLGPVNLALGFKPPTGVGLSIDAGVVTGGGFLSIDPVRGEYAGALQLEFLDFIGVSAIGIIDTKNPDGTPGFSLLIILTADFGPGIQLGFGFTLNAVGGLLGLNRGMLFQPLMDGVRSGAISDIMFPQNVVANAPRIISDLRALFPPQPGTFLIGPMAKLGWGDPTLVSVSLGVIIEIPPGDIAILGVLSLALPDADESILKLQVDFAGALEFSKSRLYFFASLYDSHLLFITIQGEMGLLVAWGDDANFVVSVGGFHPKFTPPPMPFPSPQRVQLDIINESFARIRADTYFAVTTNTAQFGTHAQFFFGFSALSVQGSSSFDALIQFSPFHFSVSISTSFSVTVFGVGVLGLDIDLTLEGTNPWHAHGSGSLSFFFFSISVPIDFTWGDRTDTTLPPVAVMPILSAEFAKRSNWKAVLPNGASLLVVLRNLDSAEADLVLHPVGNLQVSQRSVPLDLTLDKVGSQRPSDANRFALSVASGGLTKSRELQEPFAPAQFKDASDADKLSEPAFTPQDSGIELAPAATSVGTGTALTRNVRYDLTIIDTALEPVRTRFYHYPAGLFEHWLAGASVANSPLSASHHSLTHPGDGTVAVAAEMYAVAHQADNRLFAADAGSFTSRWAAEDYLRRTEAASPAIVGTAHVLPMFEVAQ